MRAHDQVIERWHTAGRTARVGGCDLKPIGHPLMPATPQCIRRGQGTVYFLSQPHHGNTLLLKVFAPSTRPNNDFLEATATHLPGCVALFTTKQRRLLRRGHIDWFNSAFRDPDLPEWIDGAILMPKAPGAPWTSVADNLREDAQQMSLAQRLAIAENLADCVGQLENAGCSHRDLSGGNVFVAEDGKVYLIDCDCLFHRDLTFPENTSSGTNGYMAPFLHRDGVGYDARASWQPTADRFALTILIAEMLLVRPGTVTHEDGAMFSQQALLAGDKTVNHLTHGLGDLSYRLADLMRQALTAQQFAECPAPAQWISALRHARRQMTHRHHGSRIRRQCAACGTPTWLDVARLHELQQKGHSALCPDCLRQQLRQAAEHRARKNQTFPEAVCDHCKCSFRLPEDKLQRLCQKGKPVLCRDCLNRQLARWESERQQLDHTHPRVTCGRCGERFRMRRQKWDHLRALGKTLLCRECFTANPPIPQPT